MKPSEYYGCSCGDCPHDKESECVRYLLGELDRVAAKVERLRTGLRRIAVCETPVAGLRPEFYGHARAIALETLEAAEAAGESDGL